MKTKQLIEAAAAVIHRNVSSGDRVFGDVGAVVLSSQGRVFTGVSIDTASWGLCAERTALAAMATAGEYTFTKVVAVWRDDRDGKLYVLPPCGICREFMHQLDERNLDAEVILGFEDSVRLKDLLPRHEWPAPLE